MKIPIGFRPTLATGSDAKRGRAAANMHWVLSADEALVIEFDAHDGLWMFTNMGVFFNSMDYLYRPVSYTPSRTAVDGDGKVRLVLAHDDPGYHNWIDTQGFERGNVTYRHMLEGEPAELHTRLSSSAPTSPTRCRRTLRPLLPRSASRRCGLGSMEFGSDFSCDSARIRSLSGRQRTRDH